VKYSRSSAGGIFLNRKNGKVLTLTMRAGLVFFAFVSTPRVFSRFDLADRKAILRDHNYFIWIVRWLHSKVFVYFDGGSKASFYCILRWDTVGKIWETILLSQNTLKTHCLLLLVVRRNRRNKPFLCKTKHVYVFWLC